MRTRVYYHCYNVNDMYIILCAELRHRMCSLLSNITNGYVTNPSDRSVGSVASYECADNFILQSNGTLTRICQGDGMWSGEEPICGELN